MKCPACGKRFELVSLHITAAAHYCPELDQMLYTNGSVISNEPPRGGYKKRKEKGDADANLLREVPSGEQRGRVLELRPKLFEREGGEAG